MNDRAEAEMEAGPPVTGQEWSQIAWRHHPDPDVELIIAFQAVVDWHRNLRKGTALARHRAARWLMDSLLEDDYGALK